jgi:hypothetical protein
VKLIDTDETILIVTGSDVPAEMNDRPLAYGLKAEIDRLGSGTTWRGGVVVSDRWYGDNRLFHLCATVVVGGPGVNAVAAALVDELPMLVQRDERAFVQGSWDGESKRASLWGLDRLATAQAIEIFVREGWCAEFLNHAWRMGTAAGRRLDLA